MLIRRLLTKKPESKHFILDVSWDKLSVLDDAQAWLRKLDRAYDVYADFVGGVPYNGKKITILESTKWNQYWAVAGNPIHWSPAGITEEFERINAGSWSFGILHEIGHDFDDVQEEGGPAPWCWNGEPTANFKMVFVIETLPDVVIFSGNNDKRYGSFSTGHPRIKEMYRIEARRIGDEQQLNFSSIDELMNRRGDSITFHLIDLKDVIGWQPFRLAFRELRLLPQHKIPSAQLDKLKLFIETVSKHADHKYDIRDFLLERGFPL